MILRRHGATARMESCREAVTLLQQFLDGELDRKTTHRVAAHVADCYECGLEIDVYRQLRKSLRGQVPLPQDAITRLRAFVDRCESGGGGEVTIGSDNDL